MLLSISVALPRAASSTVGQTARSISPGGRVCVVRLQSTGYRRLATKRSDQPMLDEYRVAICCCSMARIYNHDKLRGRAARASQGALHDTIPIPRFFWLGLINEGARHYLFPSSTEYLPFALRRYLNRTRGDAWRGTFLASSRSIIFRRAIVFTSAVRVRPLWSICRSSLVFRMLRDICPTASLETARRFVSVVKEL